MSRYVYRGNDVATNEISLEWGEENNIFTIGARYYSTAVLDDAAVPSIGTIDVYGVSAVTGQEIVLGQLDCTNVAAEFSVTKEITGVRAAPTGITGAGWYELVVVSRL